MPPLKENLRWYFGGNAAAARFMYRFPKQGIWRRALLFRFFLIPFFLDATVFRRVVNGDHIRGVQEDSFRGDLRLLVAALGLELLLVDLPVLLVLLRHARVRILLLLFLLRRLAFLLVAQLDDDIVQYFYLKK